jgi:cell division protein FtsI (penicillin-binding protein 3)
MKQRRSEAQSHARQFRIRSYWVVGAFSMVAVALLGRAVFMQGFNHSWYEKKGDRSVMRVARINAYRGTIFDRFGEPLAVSTPVDTVWVSPAEIKGNEDELPALAKALGVDPEGLIRRVTSRPDDKYLVVKPRMQPDAAAQIAAMHFTGVHLEREYQRYYPVGEVAGHLMGFDNFEDKGSAGLESAFDGMLAGEDGLKRVMQDPYGHVIEDVELIRPARSGEDLYTSIDLRIQYLAYRALKAAVQENNARAGCVLIVDVRTGEILAAANQPVFNPNNPDEKRPDLYRNRAITDVLEPGSTIKPFFVAQALATGKIRPDTTIDTGHGLIRVGNRNITDEHPLGTINIATILAKSSNVGMAHIGLKLDRPELWTFLSNLGFGSVSSIGYPGESAGVLRNYKKWSDIDVATMAHGYGISVTPIQLAQAYTTLAAGGVRRPLTFRRIEGDAPVGVQVLDKQVASDLIGLMQSVVTSGTATRAAVRGFHVSGKTGTAWKNSKGGYAKKYYALFAGMVPATNPRLMGLVIVDEPSRGKFMGGDVSAPVFSAIMTGALRLLSVQPDDLLSVPAATFVQTGFEQ